MFICHLAAIKNVIKSTQALTYFIIQSSPAGHPLAARLRPPSPKAPPSPLSSRGGSPDTHHNDLMDERSGDRMCTSPPFKRPSIDQYDSGDDDVDDMTSRSGKDDGTNGRDDSDDEERRKQRKKKTRTVFSRSQASYALCL